MRCKGYGYLVHTSDSLGSPCKCSGGKPGTSRFASSSQERVVMFPPELVRQSLHVLLHHETLSMHAKTSNCA
eukprot:3686415-Amphidinium_carterae.2